MRRFRARLLVRWLEDRLAPATLLHSLFPDPTGPQENASFGNSVATGNSFRVVGAGSSAVFGLSSVGQAFVYDVATNNLVATLNNPTPASDLFGVSVAVSGKYVVVGANFDDTGATDAGSAYVYDLSSMTATTPIATLNNPTPADSDYFGISVAVSGNYVVVGAYQDDSGATFAGSAYVYDLSSMSPTTPIATLNNPSPASSDYFGYSVAVSGNYVVVGACQDDTGATNAGSAYVYDLSSMTPTTPIATFNNPTPAESDNFGHSVAMSGKYVLAGAYLDDTGATNAGAAYVYDLASITPTTPIATLNNPTPASNDYFGISVAVSGNHVVVGANFDDTAATDAGSTYVYDLSSITPTTPIVTPTNPLPTNSDLFGSSLALSGKYLVVGSLGNDTGATNAGSAYVFDLASMTPTTPIATLNNPTPAVSDNFGYSVAVSGNYVVVGANQDDTGAANAGSAYVYNLSSMTPTTPIATLNNPTPANGDRFGISVAVSGSYVVVGAYQDDTGATFAGSAYVYDLSSMSPTTPIATLNNPTPAVSDYFGFSVAVSGNYVVVGAYQDDTGAADAGSAYVYDLSSMVPTTPIATFNNPTPVVSDYFGYSVAVSGTHVVVGAYHDDTGATNAGSAYVYDLASMVPTTPIATLNNPTPASRYWFGASVAVSGKYLVVGAYRVDMGAFGAGSAYVYDLASMTPTTPIANLNNPTPSGSGYFGPPVALSGNYVVVGANQDNTGATGAGSAYFYDLASMTPTTPVATLSNPTPSANDYFGSSVAVSGTTAVVGAPLDDDQNVNQGSARVYSLLPAKVATIQVNDGSAQRSMVTSLKINFDIPVSLVGSPAAAFALVNQTTVTAVGLSATLDPSHRFVTLTFTGGPVNGLSLADGRYTLTIVANQFAGDGFDGNGDGVAGDNYVLVGNPANKLFRLFGDADGDGTVATSDFIQFRLAFGGTSPIFDFDNDGSVAASDFIQFRLRFGGSV